MRGITGQLNMTVEPGTILGPDTIGEYHVALSTEGDVTQCGYATPAEIALALSRDPRSITEMTDRVRLAAML